MIIAITGATGFVGEALALKLCEKGYIVRLLSRSRPKICDNFATAQYKFCDLENIDVDLLRSHITGVSVLYHCAAENTEVSRMKSVNVLCTSILTDVCSGLIEHFIYVSTVGVYGTQKNGIITEDTPLQPMNEYEKTKAIAESIIVSASKKGRFSYTILRPSKIFGVNMPNKELFTLSYLIKYNLFFFIGDGRGYANYLHINNIVDALIRSSTCPAAKGKIYNVSDHCTIFGLVEIISSALKKQIPSKHLPEFFVRKIAWLTSWIPFNPLSERRINALVKKTRYSSSKIEVELGYKPIISIAQGMTELITVHEKSF
jgi:nucleoside-diphosphate-sugar epimerase